MTWQTKVQYFLLIHVFIKNQKHFESSLTVIIVKVSSGVILHFQGVCRTLETLKTLKTRKVLFWYFNLYYCQEFFCSSAGKTLNLEQFFLEIENILVSHV